MQNPGSTSFSPTYSVNVIPVKTCSQCHELIFTYFTLVSMHLYKLNITRKCQCVSQLSILISVIFIMSESIKWPIIKYVVIKSNNKCTKIMYCE